ncbi:SMI1/KNR4 family protein [Niabella aurantiaca]|uniref:SMI1/KNR4 family protein n=1 Tax=Niabella aurantiaca TaxID=379900 RepID=UPI0003668DA1|nr:SMI1/KNR4 family protein [Niabella aurantiaca]
MTPIEQLKAILTEQYITEDGDEYSAELKQGLTDRQIDKLAKDLPMKQIPEVIRELLKFSGGFEFSGLDEVTFDGVGKFGFEQFFPNSVQLAGDGFGNFWILDVERNGNWGNMFYVCHDPAVVVKHSDNLAQFIEHVNDFGKNGSESNLDIIHEKVVGDSWNKDDGF